MIAYMFITHGVIFVRIYSHILHPTKKECQDNVVVIDM
jgi:hypothetical protein